MKMKIKTSLTMLIAVTTFCLGCSPEASNPFPPVHRDREASFERVLQPLPDSGFKAQVKVDNPPVSLSRGQRADLVVRVKNLSDASWPARGRQGDGIYQINLGDRWIGTDGKDVKVDQRVFLPRVIKPAEEFEAYFPIIAPDKAGDYVVEIDMVQEGVAWFFQKGSEPLKLRIKVE